MKSKKDMAVYSGIFFILFIMTVGNAAADPAQGVETRIISNEASQESPDISGNRIVWTDNRDGGGWDSNQQPDGNWDIYMYDLSTSTETRVTTDESNQVEPAIYEDRIVWADNRNGGGRDEYGKPDGNWDIYMYDLSTSTETQITSSNSTQWKPSIYGNRIVWEDKRNGNSDVYMYDLSTSTETRITTGESNQNDPAISGNRIVWSDDRNEGLDIYMYDLSTSTETRITSDSGASKKPDIYNDLIVYEDEDITGLYVINMYSLSTSTETLIASGRTADPEIQGNRIVWMDGRNYEDSNTEIYMYDPSTSTETQVTTDNSLQGKPAIYGDRIVWEDWRNGNHDIYMFTISGEGPEQPVADFISNVTGGYAPLPVLFTDLSQKAIRRSWDFNNDGISDSTDESLVYVFTDEGTYTVNLTAINENGTASKQATITVSSAEEEHHSSSGGSSSGGGGGGSPEPAKNVEVKELAQVFITNGKEVKFDFTKNATCVVYVSFDAKKTVGKTTTIVEELKNKSALVSELPAGELYKSFNVWVGNGGYATSTNLENPEICFKVEKAWIPDKKIDQSSITLNRYSDEKWEHLPASLSGEDDKYLYFTAETREFASFAITGDAKNTKEEKETGIKSESLTGITNENGTENSGLETEQQTEKEKKPGTPGFEIIYGIACMFGVFVGKRK